MANDSGNIAGTPIPRPPFKDRDESKGMMRKIWEWLQWFAIAYITLLGWRQQGQDQKDKASQYLEFLHYFTKKDEDVHRELIFSACPIQTDRDEYADFEDRAESAGYDRDYLRLAVVRPYLRALEHKISVNAGILTVQEIVAARGHLEKQFDIAARQDMLKRLGIIKGMIKWGHHHKVIANILAPFFIMLIVLNILCLVYVMFWGFYYFLYFLYLQIQ